MSFSLPSPCATKATSFLGEEEEGEGSLLISVPADSQRRLRTLGRVVFAFGHQCNLVKGTEKWMPLLMNQLIMGASDSHTEPYDRRYKRCLALKCFALI